MIVFKVSKPSIPECVLREPQSKQMVLFGRALVLRERLMITTQLQQMFDAVKQDKFRGKIQKIDYVSVFGVFFSLNVFLTDFPG